MEEQANFGISKTASRFKFLSNGKTPYTKVDYLKIKKRSIADMLK